jgi:ribosomal-protein-alanine N-acetyltransferase
VLATRRLRLLPCDAVVARAAVEEPDRLPELLGMPVDPDWPSEDILEVLPAYADALELDRGLQRWGFFLLVEQPDFRVVGDAGFKGPPDERGVVEIGYGVVPSSEGRGYATEAVEALIAWARAQPAAREVVACCYASNVASRRVLEKCGFRQVATDGRVLDWSLPLRRAQP